MKDSSFEEWIEDQISLGNLKRVSKTNKYSNKGDLTGKWRDKYSTKRSNCREETSFDLIFEDYLYKAYEAGLTCHSQVSRKGDSDKIYHLARIGDQGDYTVDNCRFITAKENYKERDEHTDVSKVMKRHNKRRIKEGTHPLVGLRKKPWESNNANEESIRIWGLADKAYKVWKEEKVAGSGYLEN